MADLTAKNTATGAIEVPDIERNFRNVLQKYLAGDLTAQDAADRLDRLTPSPRTLVDGKTDPEEALLAFWNVLFNLVGELHDAETTDADPRHRLVNLLSRLAQLDSGTVNIYGADKALWKDLPLFGAALRDRWMQPDEHTPEAQFAKWVSLNAFLAILANNDKIKTNPPLLEFPVWTMRGAFEEEHPATAGFMGARRRAASCWLDHAKKFLVEATQSEKNQDEVFLRVTAPGKSFTGAAGLTQERIAFWYDQRHQQRAQ